MVIFFKGKDSASNFGKHSLTALIVYRSLLSLRKRYFVVMEVSFKDNMYL